MSRLGWYWGPNQRALPSTTLPIASGAFAAALRGCIRQLCSATSLAHLRRRPLHLGDLLLEVRKYMAVLLSLPLFRPHV